MTSKPPFGFRQDAEPEPEQQEECEQEHGEINNTGASIERAWSRPTRRPLNAS